MKARSTGQPEDLRVDGRSSMAEASGFRLFGLQHVLVLATLFVSGAAIVRLGRRASPARREVLGEFLGGILLGYVCVIYVQKGMAGQLSWQDSLPLELCHWVLAACVVSLFRPTQLGGEIAWYWGLGGTLQATLTPDIVEGFPSWEFIQFFWSHGGILLAIVFLCLARDFRPRPRSVRRMFIAANTYAATVGALDAIFGWNYGYLCRKPFQPSLLDHLGPWPWYIVSLEGIALASFWLLDLPWRWCRPGDAGR